MARIRTSWPPFQASPTDSSFPRMALASASPLPGQRAPRLRFGRFVPTAAIFIPVSGMAQSARRMLRRMDAGWPLLFFRKRLYRKERLGLTRTDRTFSQAFFQTLSTDHRSVVVQLVDAQYGWQQTVCTRVAESRRTCPLRRQVSPVCALSFRDFSRRTGLLPRWQVGYLHFLPRI